MNAPTARFRFVLPLGYAVAGIAWVLGSDLLLGHVSAQPAAAQLAASGKGVAFVLLSALLLWTVQAWPAATRSSAVPPVHLSPYRATFLRPVLIFLICAAGIGVGGYSLYRHQAREVHARASATLEQAADLTARQVELWLADRRGGLDYAGSNEHFAQGMRRLRQDEPPGPSAEELRAALDLLRWSEEFERIQVFTPSGDPLIASGGPIAISDALRRWARGAEVTGRVVMSDLYVPVDAVERRPVLDFIVTLNDRANAARPAAVLVARIDPARFLFPALQPSTGERLTTTFTLARRQVLGNRLLLTRWDQDPARASTIEQVSADGLTVAEQVVAGRGGVFEAVDHLGTAVIATGRPIGGTAWHLVAQVDHDGLHAPLQRIARIALLYGLAGLAGAALLVLLWWRSERTALSARLEAAEQRATRLQQHFAIAGRMVHDLVVLADAADGRIVEVNDRAVEAYGYTREELLARRVFDLHAPGSSRAASSQARFAAIVATGSGSFDVVHARKDGSTFPIEVSARTLEVDGHTYVQAIGRDVSERVEQERRLAALAADRDRALERLQLQFDRMAAAGVVLAPDGRMLQVNPAFERTFGVSAAAVVGRTVADVVQLPRFREEALARLAELRESPDSTYSGVHENVAANGRAIVCRWTAAALRAADGAIHGFIVMADDITELVRAERALRTSQARYRALTHTSPVGIFRADLRGHIVFANPRARVITGLDVDAPLEASWVRALHPGDAPVVRAEWRRYLESGGRLPHSVEFRMLRPDGSTAWVLAQVTPERDGDGNLLGHIGTITDVTDIKRAQLELQQAHDLLEQRVRERTRELEAALDVAEQSERVKSAFLSTMSHELRTPLNAILGFTDVVLQGLSGPLTLEQERQLRIVRDSSQHLRDLVEDVLDISRIEAGQVGLEYARVDLRDLLRRRLDAFGPVAARKSINLLLDAPEDGLVIDSDGRRIAQVVGNLVSNALKFTDAGEVVVRLQACEGRVEIAVSDTGVGIPADALGRIFNPFAQVVRPGGRLRDGTGLGLAISRNLARALGGDVTVQSEVGRGSRFTLWLPRELALAA